MLVCSLLYIEIHVTPVSASEEENIDSMNVYPETRWEVVTDTGMSRAVSNGILNVSDTGDGTGDDYLIKRKLAKSDSAIYIRFKYDTSTDTAGQYDQFNFFLLGGTDTDDLFAMRVYYVKNESASTVSLRYKNAGSYTSLVLDSDESLYANTWYILKMDYDTLKSQFSWKVNFDNGTKVFEYDWQDVDDSQNPTVFNEESLYAGMSFTSYTNAKYVEYLVDYVKASFKEREWETTDSVTDSDWLEDSWYFVHVQDDVADESVHQLNVPYLDSLSGVMTVELYDDTALSEDPPDSMYASFRVYAVDYDDGDLHEIVDIEMFTLVQPGTGVLQRLDLEMGGSSSDTESVTRATTADVTEQSCQFSITLSEDRTNITVHVRYWVDRSVTAGFVDMVGSYDIASNIAEASQEFVLETEWDINLVADNEIKITLDDFGLSERDIFADIVRGIGGFFGSLIEGFVNFLSTIFMTLFRWLGGLLVGAVLTLQQALTPLLESIFSVLGSVVTELQGLAGDIATAVWDGIGSALDFITEAITAIWATLEDSIADIISWLAALASDVADFLFAVIEFLVDLLIAGIDFIIDLIATAFFFFWDALSLPNLLEIWDMFATDLLTLIAGLPDFLGDFIDWMFAIYIYVPIALFAYMWLVPAVRNNNAGDFLADVVDIATTDLAHGIMLLGFGPIYFPYIALILILMVPYGAGLIPALGTAW